MEPIPLQPLSAAIADLLTRADLPDAGLTVTAQPGGRNNRAYRVAAGEQTYFLKQYFRHPGDARDRFTSETAFLRFCNDRRLAWTPRLLAADEPAGLALMEYIDGARITSDTLTHADVDQALAFFSELNVHRAHPDADALPRAADMRDSVCGHVALVEERVARLDKIPAEDRDFSAARALVANRLRPLWQTIRARAERDAACLREDPLPRARQVLSPSDFGFHNALRRRNGRICFVDFEYAGWDDPAKSLADFFLQPAVPPPTAKRADAERVIAGAAGDGEDFALRARLLQPVFAIKWCCILLNEFLPVEADRRAYAQPDVDVAARRRAQLDRLTRRLADLEREVRAP